MRRLGVALPLLVLALIALAVGCSTRKALRPNLPPETTLFVDIPADTVNHTVNHVVHLFWFGSDPDGEVAGFEWRFKNLSPPADTLWRFTTKSDSIFEVFTPAGVSMPLFQVRAIDNSGLKDPSPAAEDFTFSNHAPTVSLVSPPGPTDTTYAAVTMTFNANDPDGDAISFKVWINSDTLNAITTTLRVFPVPPEAFCQDGFYRTGACTLHVQAVDNGGMKGSIATTTWPVRAPVGSEWPCDQKAPLLIVDDVPVAAPGNASVDAIYRNAALRNLGNVEANFSVFRIGGGLTFRSSADLASTFKLFKGVIWYRDLQSTTSPLLRDRQAGIIDYLGNGGNFFLEGLNLYSGQNASGAFGPDFQRDYLRVDSLARYFDINLGDFTSAWGNQNSGVFRSNIRLGGTVFQDSIRLALLPGTGLRAFGVRDTNDVAVWAPDESLNPAVPRRLPVGLSVVQPSGGRMVTLTFAVRAANGFANLPTFLDKIFQQMGLGPP